MPHGILIQNEFRDVPGVIRQLFLCRQTEFQAGIPVCRCVRYLRFFRDEEEEPLTLDDALPDMQQAFSGPYAAP